MNRRSVRAQPASFDLKREVTGYSQFRIKSDLRLTMVAGKEVANNGYFTGITPNKEGAVGSKH
jgi:hypothetical protein